MLGLNLSAYSAWALANFAGALAGDRVGSIRALGFDFALAAMFGALLVLQLAAQASTARLSGLVVASLAALLSVTVTLVLPGNWNILIATLLAATAGLFFQQWKSANTSF